MTTFAAAIPPPAAEIGTLRPLPPNPCNPHPCGSNAVCQVVFNTAQCACTAGMIGTAPSCRPECIGASDCPSRQGCVNQKCVDPCPGTCAQNANCRVINHSPVCSCRPGFTGNAYANCRPLPAVGKALEEVVRLLFSQADAQNAIIDINAFRFKKKHPYHIQSAAYNHPSQALLIAVD